MLPLGLKRSKVDGRMGRCRTGEDRMRVMGITALKYPSGNHYYLCHFRGHSVPPPDHSHVSPSEKGGSRIGLGQRRCQ